MKHAPILLPHPHRTPACAAPYEGVPDFESMTEEDLMAFWARYHRPRRADAARLLGHTAPGYTVLAAKLANYACNRAVALGCHRRGNHDTAELYEATCARMRAELGRLLGGAQ